MLTRTPRLRWRDDEDQSGSETENGRKFSTVQERWQPDSMDQIIPD